jgi:FRG domain
METIGEQKVWSFAEKARRALPATCTTVRKRAAYKVRSYMDLATKVADLQFMNRDYVLLFRGQNSDHKNRQRNTSLKPSMFRQAGGGNPNAGVLIRRFDTLRNAERHLVGLYSRSKLAGHDRLQRQQILRWAILQHYEVCPTPLLDVTHSLRIAASFASEGADDEAFIFVVGVPNLSGAITASAEAGLQIVRLSSVCPPSAVRPHIQEGYLLGEYPEMTGYDQKQYYAHYEIDFGRRLVAKFWFNPKTFWKKDSPFPRVSKEALYPSPDDDPLYKLALEVKQAIVRKNA